MRELIFREPVGLTRRRVEVQVKRLFHLVDVRVYWALLIRVFTNKNSRRIRVKFMIMWLFTWNMLDRSKFHDNMCL